MNAQRATISDQRATTSASSRRYTFPITRPKRPVNYARACFENMALVPLCGQVKTVLRKARPKRPMRPSGPDPMGLVPPRILADLMA